MQLVFFTVKLTTSTCFFSNCGSCSNPVQFAVQLKIYLFAEVPKIQQLIVPYWSVTLCLIRSVNKISLRKGLWKPGEIIFI